MKLTIGLVIGFLVGFVFFNPLYGFVLLAFWEQYHAFIVFVGYVIAICSCTVGACEILLYVVKKGVVCLNKLNSRNLRRLKQ